ncbi:MAG TPA: hypothetical protein VFR22_10480 [Nocardioidaceae bacterium]|nr:hypothetical protein [Nocardioidaceae bacterium]
MAAYSEKAGALVVKLPSERVLELIGSGDGDPFEPAGKRFREWVSIPTVDRTLWQSLLTEAVDFARKGLATSSAQLPPTQSSPSPHRRRGTDRPGGAGTRWWSALDVADPVDAEPADVGAVPVHARAIDVALDRPSPPTSTSSRCRSAGRGVPDAPRDEIRSPVSDRPEAFVGGVRGRPPMAGSDQS